MAKNNLDVSYINRLMCGVKMILPVSNHNSSINFLSEPKNDEKKLPYSKDTLLKNNLATRMRIGMDKFSNALTVYPVKGLRGSRNSNFYEFLTMGTIPYLVGSGTLMAVFNLANKYFKPFAESKASAIGKKMALGVLFYGVMKEVSKSFITKPVHALTGVDTTVPYAKFIYELPENINDTDITSIEYHQAYESVEFPYWGMFYKDESSGKPRNAYFDKVAKKLGMGENLNDSDQEVKPRIKEIVVKTMTAKNLTSYLWAALGVCTAFQEPWDKFFNTKGFKPSVKQFGASLWESMKDFYKGQGSGITKHAGKLLLGTAVLSSVLGVANVMSSSQKPSKLDSADIIEKSGKYVVN